MQYQQPRGPVYFIGGLIFLATVVSLVLSFLLMTGIMKPPKSWGPKPWGAEAREARHLVETFADTSSVPTRVRAIEKILAARSPEAIHDMQGKAFADASPSVRAAAVGGLLNCLTNSPGLLVKKNAFGWRVGTFVRIDMLEKMGSEDSSPDVRIAVARFWRDATEFSSEAKANLQRMLGTTTERDVQEAIRASLAAVNSR